MQNNENEVVYLHLDDIIPNRFQPRQVFDERALKELAVSIKEHGVIQPIIVRNIGNKYEIIAGERRYKASALAGLTKIPAIIRDLDDKESSKVALLENLQRKNLNPMEEARTYQKILELDEMTQEELAKTMGKSQSSIANKIRLLSLSDEVQDALLKEQISERHARSLLSIPDKQEQEKMLRKVIENKMTVRELEDAIHPKTEMKMDEITSLLNTTPVPTQDKVQEVTSEIPDVSVPNSVATDFNQSVGIDYSTPPKFIEYDTEDKTPSITDSLLESTANNPIDINQIRANAADINVEEEKPKVDLDRLLKVTKKEEDTTSSDGGDETESPFKFFAPTDDSIDHTEEKNEEVSPTTTSFDFPNVIEQKPNQEEVSALDQLLTSNKEEKEITLDSLLQNNKPQEKEEETQKIPYLDTYNNPFAKNPIFSDDIEKIVGNMNQDGTSVPRYSFNECLEQLRNTIKTIEMSGFKVDSEETNFDKSYQIVIKINKKEEESQK